MQINAAVAHGNRQPLALEPVDLAAGIYGFRELSKAPSVFVQKA